MDSVPARIPPDALQPKGLVFNWKGGAFVNNTPAFVGRCPKQGRVFAAAITVIAFGPFHTSARVSTRRYLPTTDNGRIG